MLTYLLIGLGGFLVGGLGLTYLAVMWIITRLNASTEDDLSLHETAIFYYCILAVLLGAQLLVAGLLAELVVSRTSQSHRPYSIAERIGEAKSVATQAGGDDGHI